MARIAMFPKFEETRPLPASVQSDLPELPFEVKAEGDTLVAVIPGERAPLLVTITKDGWLALFRSTRKEAAAIVVKSPCGRFSVFWRGQHTPNDIEEFLLEEEDKPENLPSISEDELARLPRLCPAGDGKWAIFDREPRKVTIPGGFSLSY